MNRLLKSAVAVLLALALLCGLLFWLLTREAQPTVWDDPEHPQYMTYLPDGSCVPLSAENNWSALGNYTKEAGLLNRIKRIFADWKRIFALLFRVEK